MSRWVREVKVGFQKRETSGAFEFKSFTISGGKDVILILAARTLCDQLGQTRPSLCGCLRVPGFCGAGIASFISELGGCDIQFLQLEDVPSVAKRDDQTPKSEFRLRLCSDLAKGRPVALQRELWEWLWLLCSQLVALTCRIHKGLGLAEGCRLRVAEEPNGHVESVF